MVGSSVSKSSVSIFNRVREGGGGGDPLPDVVREVEESVRIDLRFIVCRCTVLAPQPAFQHFRNGIPPLIRSSLALTWLRINRKGDSSTVDPHGTLEWCPHIGSEAA